MRSLLVLLLSTLATASVFAQVSEQSQTAPLAAPVATPLERVQSVLTRLSDYAFLEEVDRETAVAVKNQRVPLGAMQKVRGVWSPRSSERLTGSVERFTWQVMDGFRSLELVSELEESLSAVPGVELMFSCDARACGSSSQWANRIFGERLLYGTESSQRYRAYGFTADAAGGDAPDASTGLSAGTSTETPATEDYRLLVYASSRGTNREYLRIELLRGQASPEELRR